MPRNIGVDEAKQKAARFCALRERSPKEVVDQLFSWGLFEDQIHEVLNQLMKEGFVNPQRFANAFCHDKFEFNSWGKQKIRMNIRIHQLNDDVVETALSRIKDDQYTSRLLELAAKKWESLDKEPSLKRRQKTISFLSNKGFEMDLIWKTIKSLSR